MTKTKIVFIAGVSEHAFMLHSMVELEGVIEVAGHTLSEAYVESARDECESRGYELRSLQSLAGLRGVGVLNAIGYSGMNAARESVAAQCGNLGLELVSFVSDRAVCLSDGFGAGNIVMPGAYVGTNVVLGDGNVCYAGSVLTHDVEMGSYNFVAANATVGGFVRVGDGCFLGMGSVVKNGVEVRDRTLLGAGAYLSCDTCPQDVYVPARSVKLPKLSCDLRI